MANKPTQPVFPLGLAAEEQSTLAGVLNTGTIEHGPDAVLTLPEGNASAGLPSSVRYNADSDEFEGFYENGGWLPLGGGGIRWEVLPHASTATLTEGRGYLVNNTTGASTVVLPSPTRIGDSVTICDAYGKFATYPLTVSPSGNNLYGSTEDMAITTDNVSATFTWSGPEQGWIITSGVGLGQGRVYSREIFTKILASETSAVTLNTPPTIVDVYADGKRLAESKYSLDGNVITFSPSLPASTELQVIEYTPIQLGTGGGSSSSTITWVYNGGSAIGGETEITLDVVVDDVPAIDINGSRQYKNLGFTFDPLTSKITLAQELEPEDEVVVIINGTPNIYNQIDYTLREVARVTNVKDTEVVYFSVGAVLSGYKVIYDKVTQRSYFIPELPTGTTAVSLSSSAILVHSSGSVDLGALAVSREEYVTLSGSFDTGVTVNVKNELVVFTDGKYRWDGELPKEVSAGSTPETAGGVGVGKWLSVGDGSLRTEIASDSGLSIIGTNHRGTLQADLDRIDNRTSGQSISDLQANTGDVAIDTSVTLPLFPVANSRIAGNFGGELVATKATTALSGSANRVLVEGLMARGDGTVDYADTSPTYTFSLSGPDTTYFNCYAKDATMGFDLRTGADHAKVIGCRTENMTSHPNLGGKGLSAGGYGVLLNGNTDVFILGHTSKGTNPADRHVLYLSNTNTATPNRDVRAIGVRGDFTAVSQGDKPEMHSPMVFGRNNQGVIVDASQFRGGGGGFNWTDERGTYEMISISNTQLNDIRKNDAAETCGIAFNHAESTNPGQINNVISVSNVQMTLTDGGKGADRSNQFPLLFNSSRYVNVNNVSFGCSGKAYGIRLIKTSYANISNIVGWTNDGTSATDAVAFIQFMQGSSNIKLSNINPQSRLKMFEGLDQVTDLQVDWVRKVRINVVSGSATVSGDSWELVSSVSTGSNSIVVTLKPHVTQLAVDGAMVRAASGNQFVVTGTSSKTLTISVYNVNGTGVVPNTGTYSFDVVLYQ